MNWFESWFDSPYYHILYQHRDDHEAENFINKLYSQLNIKQTESILDLACGKGRHSLQLARKGNQIIGIDLASNSIEQAINDQNNQQIGENLKFEVADMRDFELNQSFDYIFNLFTSFGYFTDKSDNQKVVNQISKHQSKGGVVVIDYLNSENVYKNGNHKSVQTIQNIDFHIHKYIVQDIVYKEIEFTDKGIEYSFKEQVQLFKPKEIEKYFEIENYRLISEFGDYDLNPYQEDSTRSILILQK